MCWTSAAASANGGTSCANYDPIDQSYGDTTFGDVSYRSVNVDDSTTFENFLRYWDDEYGDLVDVVWGGTDDTGYISEIAIDPAPGFEVSLVGFDLTGWPNTDRPSQVTVYSLDFGEVLYSRGPSQRPLEARANDGIPLPMCGRYTHALTWREIVALYRITELAAERAPSWFPRSISGARRTSSGGAPRR